MKRRKVISDRNSRSGSCSSVKKLDFDWWWIDGGPGSLSLHPHALYLHVRHKKDDIDPEGETTHRVHCRLASKSTTKEIGLGCKAGELYWIVREHGDRIRFKTLKPKVKSKK
jgi:hypothetical protein